MLSNRFTLQRREMFSPNQAEFPAKRKTSPYRDDNENSKSFKSLLRDFSGYTSVNGVGRLAESKTILWRIFWSLVCLGALGMFIYQAIGLFELYSSRPISISLSVTVKKVR